MTIDSDRLYRISGSVEKSLEPDDSTVSYPLFSGSTLPVVQTSSLLIKNSVRHVREKQSKLVGRLRLGKAYNSEIGQAGTQNALAAPPTIVHSTLGVNHAYVAHALSASRHEQQALNCRLSGTEILESSVVPASGTLYYEKTIPLRTVTYKYCTTTALDWPFSASYGAIVSASINTVSNPRKFRVNVNETGKLRNIRVWVELAHLSESGKYPQLEDVGIAIRSPNVAWGHAHPIRNDKRFQSWKSGSLTPPDFWHNSFVLWEGVALFDGNQAGGNYKDYVRSRYPCWGLDRNMRTIFDDGAQIPNPRRLDGSPGRNTNGAPNSAVDSSPTALGNDTSWTTETILAGGLGAAGSPPVGWLTGPGGSTGSAEWPTTGSNMGAPFVRPVYPLLDDVYETKQAIDGVDAIGYGSTVGKEWNDRHLWNGFRPGLRNTEISGTWEILFARGQPNSETTQTFTFVRQWRLELTYEVGHPSVVISRRRSVLGKSRRMDFSSKPGRYPVMEISGSDGVGDIAGAPVITSPEQNYFKNTVWISVPDDVEIGRTFGIVTDTGSLDEGNFSLFYRLSGALGDRVGESPHWLLSNKFRMPMIPEASSSLVSVTPEVMTVVPGGRSVLEVISPSNQKQTTAAGYARTTKKPKTLQQLAAEFSAEPAQRERKASDINGTYVYVCDGTEGTDFFINLPYALSNAKYEVFGSFNGVDGSTAIDFPNLTAGDRTKERFRVVLGAATTSGDRIAFTVETTIKEI